MIPIYCESNLANETLDFDNEISRTWLARRLQTMRIADPDESIGLAGLKSSIKTQASCVISTVIIITAPLRY